MGEYLFEDAARIPVEVEYASEFRYRNPVITSDDVVIAISQSGETADTLAAIKLAKEAGAFVFGICNVVGARLHVLPIRVLTRMQVQKLEWHQPRPLLHKSHC